METEGEGLEQLSDRLEELSERQREHARELIDQIEKFRRESRDRGMNVATLDADRLLQKLRAPNTPFIYGVSWNYRTPAPGTFAASVGIDNPDPDQTFFIYVHFYVGPGSLVADPVQALAFVDTRFPRATEPELPGLQIPAYDHGFVSFNLPLSGHLEDSHYMANVLLIEQTPFDVGRVLDRQFLMLKVQDAPAI